MPTEPKPTILVVEDEAVTRMHVADHLRDCGFSVVEAASGPDAVEVLKSGPAVDVVFSDIMMPGQPDGLGLLQWIRASLPSLPVILTSGDPTKGKTAVALANSHFVAKPYDLDSVVERIRAVMA